MSPEQAQHINNLAEEPEIIIPPQTNLRKRVVISGSSNSAFRRAIQAAEQAIDELSTEFEGWITQDVEKMMSVCLTIQNEGWSKENAEALFTVTHDLKGQATTLGYPIISDICNTLAQLLERTPAPSAINAKVIITFTEAIRTIITQCKQNEDNPKATAISSGLRQMAMKILKHQLEKQAAE